MTKLHEIHSALRNAAIAILFLFGCAGCHAPQEPFTLPAGAKIELKHQANGLKSDVRLLVANFPRSEVAKLLREDPYSRARTFSDFNAAAQTPLHVAGWEPHEAKVYISGVIRLSESRSLAFTISLDDPATAKGYFLLFDGK